MPLEPAPGPEWIQAFSGHDWGGALGLKLQPPPIITVDGATGIGLRDAHIDGTIAPYPTIYAAVLDGVAYANAVTDGSVADGARWQRQRQWLVQELLRSQRGAQRRPESPN